jgi:membrane protein CcdC involved in cytochrome C biogenesis
MPPRDDRHHRRRRSLYVKQNKAYQMLLALLIICFIFVSLVVANNVLLPSGSTWKDNVLMRMIIERNIARNEGRGN